MVNKCWLTYPEVWLLIITGIEALPDDDMFLLEDGPSPQITRSGCYRGVCVHLKLHHLAVAAVDQAAQLAELAGAVTLEGLLGPAAPAFKVLRDLVEVSRASWVATHALICLL
eukprot:GHUV01041691.1.p1 GENE.GHUV01041691.1~~GHUV01041691.1.p1  ORF type:complete len:113 (-),score=36.79 GHUV01041691.1:541-879(-)